MKLVSKKQSTEVKKECQTAIKFGLGRRAKSTAVRNKEMAWPQFCDLMRDYAKEDGVQFTGRESKEEYLETKYRQHWIGAQFDGERNNNTVNCRSIIYIDLDGVDFETVKRVGNALKEKGVAYLRHTTSGDLHDLKGGKRAFRFLVPTSRPMHADEIFTVQHALLQWLGVADLDGVDMTAQQRARIMFMPPLGARVSVHDGKAVSVLRMLTLAENYDIPSESGSTVWTDEALANADANSQAIAEFCFEHGFDMMPSQRGFAVCCPNHMAHSDGNDGSENGSTAILLPDATHPEVRFQCFHDSCQGLNSHQHLAMQLLGIPDSYLPEAHNISRKQLAEVLPFMDDADIEFWHQKQLADADAGASLRECTAEDLADEVCAADMFTKRDPIIDGIMNFKSTFELIGESNIGKSFFLLGQMACVAAGIPFAGKRVVKAHCFYFDAEGGGTTVDRKQGLQKVYGDDLDWLHIVDIQAERWDLRSEKGQKAILRYIAEQAGENPVGIIAFDSLNQSVVIGDEAFDENNSSDMGHVATALKTLADETGGCVGVVHHPAKGQNGSTKRVGRGSGALHGAVDYVYFVDQPNEERHGELNYHMEKNRSGVKQTPRGFVLRKVEIETANDAAEFDKFFSDNAGPDFDDYLDGLSVKPYEDIPRNQTLVLIPVALRQFETQAAEAGREAVKGFKAANDEENTNGPRDKAEKDILAALEALQNSDDRDDGWSGSQIRPLLEEKTPIMGTLDKLVKRKLVAYGKDEDGKPLDGKGGRFKKYKIATSAHDFEYTETDDDDEE